MEIENTDDIHNLDLFTDRVNTRATELVSYIRKFFQAHVDAYNKDLKPGEEPKCSICETEAFLEELVEMINGSTHLSNETHDTYHEILYKQHDYNGMDGGE